MVIVTTIQSFRREDESGKENPEGLKVYEDAGALMDHFASLTEEQKAPLDLVEGTSRPVASLANLLRLHRPMVIVDEAHNSRSDLSFRTLARFSPSLILELTATPQTEHKPERGKHASNILYAVSAAELKAEEMIKMPVRLTTDGEWAKTVGAALDCQRMLVRSGQGRRGRDRRVYPPDHPISGAKRVQDGPDTADMGSHREALDGRPAHPEGTDRGSHRAAQRP